MKKENQNNPLVSMVLMAFNRQQLLPTLLDSLLAQTFRDFELIVFDDGLSDETKKICGEYIKKDARVVYFRPKKNLNVPASFKVAPSLARGKYFMWVQDDDLYDERFLEDCVSVHRAHPEFIMVFADMVDIDKNEKVFKHFDPAQYMPFGTNTYERLKRQMLNHFHDGKNQLIAGLWRREFILDDPLFGPRAKDDLPQFYWGFENYFVFRNIAKGPFGFVPQTRFLRRSRVLEDTRPPRPFLARMTITFFHRLEKILCSPYFYYIFHRIWKINGLSLWQKLKLSFWNAYVMSRLFFVRKI